MCIKMQEVKVIDVDWQRTRVIPGPASKAPLFFPSSTLQTHIPWDILGQRFPRFRHSVSISYHRDLLDIELVWREVWRGVGPEEVLLVVAFGCWTVFAFPRMSQSPRSIQRPRGSQGRRIKKQKNYYYYQKTIKMTPWFQNVEHKNCHTQQDSATTS